jgi:hypothetical protein
MLTIHSAGSTGLPDELMSRLNIYCQVKMRHSHLTGLENCGTKGACKDTLSSSREHSCWLIIWQYNIATAINPQHRIFFMLIESWSTPCINDGNYLNGQSDDSKDEIVLCTGQHHPHMIDPPAQLEHHTHLVRMMEISTH